jgi:signal peptidase II
MSPALRLRLGYGLVAGAVVIVDQITKRLVDRFMTLLESRELLPGLLQLTPVHNRGAAFGFLSNVEFAGQAGLLALVSLVALAVILLYALWLSPARLRPQIALALVLGGAVGNLIDRLTLGYVIDFVDVFWRTHHWPMFNAADSAISIGVALLVLDMLREPSPASQEGQGREAETESAGRME